MNLTKPLLSSKRILIVGLGNPSPAYDLTRHNVGNWLLDQLVSRRWNGFTQFKKDRRYRHFEISQTSAPEYSHLVLAKSVNTYMNIQGPAVKQLWTSFKKEKNDDPTLMIIHDEIEIGLGKVQLRKGSTSARGHNGLRSISTQLDPTYTKMGLGIDKPDKLSNIKVLDYVLSKFYRNELDVLESVTLEQASKLIEEVAKGLHSK
ncbi:hypothetical protein PUMCH_000321 [Australozyma saopauloensis]|uniref:Peptidyl-tRNA hydrolase n=1 Tax=Australozyma saopauloensis TaxID=291208 RepID=A0AAX4H3G0_9ASCO|nr:hypothetical protein PUMCH_000321 [[Candida] saopauloensis]